MSDEANFGDGISREGSQHGGPEHSSKQPDDVSILSAFSPEEVNEMKETARKMDMPTGHMEGFLAFSKNVKELQNSAIPPKEKEDIKNNIRVILSSDDSPIRQEQLEYWIDNAFSTLSDEEKQALKDDFLKETKALTEDEKRELTPDEESTMEAKKNGIIKEAEQAEKDEIKAIDASDLDEKQKIELKAQASTTLGRIRGLFLPGETGHVWTKRLGRGLGYTALAIAIALLAYMKAIHSLSRQGGGRR